MTRPEGGTRLCDTCRHNAGATCTRLYRGLTPYWWQWGGKLPRNTKPGRGAKTCPRWEAR